MKKDKAYLQDILDSISDIESFITNITEIEFYKNKEKKYAVVDITKTCVSGLSMKAAVIYTVNRFMT